MLHFLLSLFEINFAIDSIHNPHKNVCTATWNSSFWLKWCTLKWRLNNLAGNGGMMMMMMKIWRYFAASNQKRTSDTLSNRRILFHRYSEFQTKSFLIMINVLAKWRKLMNEKMNWMISLRWFTSSLLSEKFDLRKKTRNKFAEGNSILNALYVQGIGYKNRSVHLSGPIHFFLYVAPFIALHLTQ